MAKNDNAAEQKPRARKKRGAWRWVLGGLAWFVIALIIAGIYLTHDLPPIDAAAPPRPEPSMVIVARDGSTIATYGDVYGDWLRFEEFPEPLVAAAIATEDRRFFSHIGIDIKGILRAGVKNMLAGGLVEGGSTITQQLAKNLFLSSERTLRRKVQEIILALWLELRLKKRDILTLYFNRMFFGDRAYSVDAAARTYFGHSARKLSVAEAALLVGLLKAPSALAPTRDYEAAVARSHEVIDNMVEVGALDAEEAAVAKMKPPKVLRSLVGTDSRYFADWVSDSVAQQDKARGVPLIVETTLDPRAQEIAERALLRSLNSEGIPGNITQGAVVVMTTDGAVRAMVGGRAYGESQFNRAVQARRQPGSAFKLFVYLAALEVGMTPDDVLRDSPVVFDGWEPANYDGQYQGAVTLRWAFAQSINTVAVKLSEMVDRHRVIKVARQLGVASPLKATPSLALGASEVTLLELTAAYAGVANGGYAVTPSGIAEVRSNKGKLLSRRKRGVGPQVIAPGANELMRSMLEDVVRYGTGSAARLGDRPAYGKTGTSQESRDAWFIGFAGDYVVGVWLGNDDGTPMRQVSGGAAPARLWRTVMEGLIHGNRLVPSGRPMMRPGSGEAEKAQSPGFFQRLKERMKALEGE